MRTEEGKGVSTFDWSLWIREYSEPLLNRAYFLLSDREDAKDIVQDVFLAAYTNHAKFKGESAPLTWLMSILYNKVSDRYKQRYRVPIHESNALNEFNIDGEWMNPETLKSWPAEESSQMSLLDDLSFRKVFYRCLENLPEQWKMTIKMCYLEKKKTREICNSLDISTPNYWKILQRSRMQLRKCLEKHWFDT